MKKNKLILTPLFLGFIFTGMTAQSFYSCDRWATYSNNGYNVYNNIWGSGYGTQCLTATAYNKWSVLANHPTTGGIKSYPNVSKELSINLSQLASCASNFTVTRPGSGSYSSTYDIWCNNYAYEIMIWMNYTGAVGPIAESWNASGQPVASATNQSIGGHTFNVYRGSNGSNMVYSFLRTSNTNSGTVNIKAILDWIRNRGWFGDVNLHKIEFGFEITSAPNVTFAVTNYSLSYSQGSSCSPTTITPYVQINNGSWQQTSTASLSAGGTVKFGPQPASGGSWRWSGPNGFSATTREVTISNIQTSQAGTYTATYTNSCGAQSTRAFTVTVSGSGGGSAVTIRARGTQGGEQIQLRLNGSTVGTWTLTTSYANYSASGTGTVEVHFTNDNGPRDVQIDYAIINGTTYQAESQSVNTGIYANGSCGGGSNSEWLHCNGYIRWGTTAKSTADIETSSELTIYPNPLLNGVLTVALGSLRGTTIIQITDISGRILEQLTTTDQQIVELSLDIIPGLYLVRVLNGEESYMSKLLVK